MTTTTGVVIRYIFEILQKRLRLPQKKSPFLSRRSVEDVPHPGILVYKVNFSRKRTVEVAVQ